MWFPVGRIPCSSYCVLYTIYRHCDDWWHQTRGNITLNQKDIQIQKLSGNGNLRDVLLLTAGSNNIAGRLSTVLWCGWGRALTKCNSICLHSLDAERQETRKVKPNLDNNVKCLLLPVPSKTLIKEQKLKCRVWTTAVHHIDHAHRLTLNFCKSQPLARQFW